MHLATIRGVWNDRVVRLHPADFDGQRTLQDHFQRGSLFNTNVLTAREQDLRKSDCGANTASNAGIFIAAAHDRAYYRAGRTGLGYCAGVLPFLAVGFDRAFFVGDGMIDRSW